MSGKYPAPVSKYLAYPVLASILFLLFLLLLSSGGNNIIRSLSTNTLIASIVLACAPTFARFCASLFAPIFARICRVSLGGACGGWLGKDGFSPSAPCRYPLGASLSIPAQFPSGGDLFNCKLLYLLYKLAFGMKKHGGT